MAPHCDDRRVLRTKRTLRSALAQLMVEQQGIENVTVGMLTDRADLNRGTFYAHYTDKTDLLHACEDDFIEQLKEMQAGLQKISIDQVMDVILEGKPLPFAVSLYDFLRENGEWLTAILGPYGDASFQVRLRDTVSSYFIESILSDQYVRNMTPLTEYYIAYYASAQLGVIQHWLERGMVESSEEMAQTVLSIMFLRPGDAIAPLFNASEHVRETNGAATPVAASVR